MLKPGMQSSEGKTSIGIIAAGCFFIYYILSSRNPTMPSIDHILANAENAVDIAKAYADANAAGVADPSGNIFDGGAIVAILFSVYKTYSKYTDGRVSLKLEEGKIKNTDASTGLTNEPAVTSEVPKSLKSF